MVPDLTTTFSLVQKSVAVPVGVPFTLCVHAPGANVNAWPVPVPVFLNVTVVVETLVVPPAFVGTITTLPPYLLIVAQVAAFTLIVVLSVLLHVAPPVAVLISCRMSVPDAPVFTELVIAAVNAENVLVIDNDNTPAPAKPAATNSTDNRRTRGVLNHPGKSRDSTS